ncbi:hypothetical protein KEJ25_07940 [Candidatus Bathyarchaeota archaeon]|nr:hypothetical protein [Candidatus Bathyarchaeota archaeon]
MFEKTLAEKILKELRKELTARIEWAKEELERYSEQLNAVNKALEELKKLSSPKEKRYDEVD